MSSLQIRKHETAIINHIIIANVNRLLTVSNDRNGHKKSNAARLCHYNNSTQPITDLYVCDPTQTNATPNPWIEPTHEQL